MYKNDTTTWSAVQLQATWMMSKLFIQRSRFYRCVQWSSSMKMKPNSILNSGNTPMMPFFFHRIIIHYFYLCFSWCLPQTQHICSLEEHTFSVLSVVLNVVVFGFIVVSSHGIFFSFGSFDSTRSSNMKYTQTHTQKHGNLLEMKRNYFHFLAYGYLMPYFIHI